MATTEYYQLITSLCREGGLNYPVIIIYSVEFQETISLLKKKHYPEFINKISEATRNLCRAGADFALIASNTPHMFFDEIKSKSPLPLLSIVEATAKVASKHKIKTVGLMGTKFTMQSDFYQREFSKFGMNVVVPEMKEQDYIHQKIMTELVKRQIIEKTRQEIAAITKKMIKERSIEALILGCTELPLINPAKYVNIPILDTTEIHAKAAFDYALSE